MLCDFHRRVHCQFNRNNEFSIAQRTHKLPRTQYPFIHKTFPYSISVSFGLFCTRHSNRHAKIQPQQTIHQPYREVAWHTSAQRSLAVNSKMHDAHGTFFLFRWVLGELRRAQKSVGWTLMSIERR